MMNTGTLHDDPESRILAIHQPPEPRTASFVLSAAMTWIITTPAIARMRR